MRLLSEAEFTESEQMLWHGFDPFILHRIPGRSKILRGVTVCLTCGGLRGTGLGNTCGGCKDVKGSIAKPDILVMAFHETDFWRPVAMGVVRVDGGIHTKNRRHIMWDYHQTERLREFGFKVFIVKNEELVSELTNNAIAFYILSMMHDDNLYQQYMRSGDVMERVRRPL